MASLMTIGEFSQATRLSAKSLRFYHRSGVLEPASIDRSNGYRLYGIDQIAHAQVIRQLRALSVPVSTIRDILQAPDVAIRNGLISDHLRRLEEELAATRTAVESVRGLLNTPPPQREVELRSVPATPSLIIREVIDLSDLDQWYRSATAELDAVAATNRWQPAGPRGGVWATDLFAEEHGEAALHYPVLRLDGATGLTGRVRAQILPAVDLAVMVHRGPDETMAQTYGALGAYVAEHEIGVSGPIRETYLAPESQGSSDAVTEVGWPVFRTGR